MAGTWPPTQERLKKQWKEGREGGRDRGKKEGKVGGREGGKREGGSLKENTFVFPRNAVH